MANPTPTGTRPDAPPGRTGLRRPSVLAWVRLLRVYHKIGRAAAEQLRAYGLSMGQFDVLSAVGASGGLTQQELADKLLVTKGNVCQLLDRMERDGLLVRCSEGRANRIWLTEKGRAVYSEAVPAHEDFIHAQLAHIPPREQAELHALLRDLDRALP
jgi:DNA-binding MarR family transcriptional regulator